MVSPTQYSGIFVKGQDLKKNKNFPEYWVGGNKLSNCGDCTSAQLEIRFTLFRNAPVLFTLLHHSLAKWLRA